jgi:hypothetical protein
MQAEYLSISCHKGQPERHRSMNGADLTDQLRLALSHLNAKKSATSHFCAKGRPDLFHVRSRRPCTRTRNVKCLPRVRALLQALSARIMAIDCDS